MPPLHAERLYGLLGQERDQNETTRLIRDYAKGEGAPVIGAHHVTCSDEAERECIDAFQRGFVRYALPSLKFFHQAPFRTANLGGRYEWGSIPIAEDHFALAKGAEAWKLLLVKINAHVSVENGPEGPRYGKLARYGSESVYCGAIDALLNERSLPFADEMHATFELEGIDRLATLRDTKRIPVEARSLYAAILSARLQARWAMVEIQDHVPRSPTLYVVLPCVSINRSGHDTEIICGVYTSDRRDPTDPHDEYCGLGDRPELYELTRQGQSVTVTDPHLHEPRHARDHRAAVLAQWREREERFERPQRLEEALKVADRAPKTQPALAKAALTGLLAVLTEVAPVPAALVLFSSGALGIHHAVQAHRLAREAEGDPVARKMLAELRRELEDLPPEKAQHLIELLKQEYRG